MISDAVARIVIRAGLDRIRRDGWVQDLYENGDGGGVCLIGALSYGFTGNALGLSLNEIPMSDIAPACKLVYRVLRDQYPGEVKETDSYYEYVNTIIGWNDDEARDQEEVEAVLEKAAQELCA